MSKEPMSKEPEMPKVSHYVTPPKRPGVSKEPHSGIKKVKNEPGESKVTDRYLAGYIHMRVVGGVGRWTKTSAEIAFLTLAR